MALSYITPHANNLISSRSFHIAGRLSLVRTFLIKIQFRGSGARSPFLDFRTEFRPRLDVVMGITSKVGQSWLCGLDHIDC